MVAFVDFGMVGTLSKNLKKAMKDVFLGFVAKDSHTLVEALAGLGFIGQNANMTAIERGVALMMERYFGMTLGEVREIDIPDVSREIEDLLYGQPFYIPAQFAFTGKAIGTLVGVATGLAPEFNFIDVATPYARNFLGLDAEGAGQTVQEIFNQLLDTGRTLLALPRALDRVITKLEDGADRGQAGGKPAQWPWASSWPPRQQWERSRQWLLSGAGRLLVDAALPGGDSSRRDADGASPIHTRLVLPGPGWNHRAGTVDQTMIEAHAGRVRRTLRCIRYGLASYSPPVLRSLVPEVRYPVEGRIRKGLYLKTACLL